MGNILSSQKNKNSNSSNSSNSSNISNISDELTLAKNTAKYWENHCKSIIQENSRLHSIIEIIQTEK